MLINIKKMTKYKLKQSGSGILSVFFYFLLLSTTLFAKDLPWSETTYTHFSDQEPLKDFFAALAASQKTPVVVSENIDTVVSGYYKKMMPKTIFLEVIKSNGLVWYFDGNTLFINREDEMQAGTVSLENTSASAFTSALERLGVLDHHYHWVASDIDQMVYFKGPEQFVSTVLAMSKSLDKKQKKVSIYKWVDNKGVTNFSSSLPEKGKASVDLTLEVHNSARVPVPVRKDRIVVLDKSEYQ